MIIKLKNIGKIKSATVDIKGITVVAGANNTGKSTIGKALYSVMHSLYRIDYVVQQYRINNTLNPLKGIGFYNKISDKMRSIAFSRKLAQDILDNVDVKSQDCKKDVRDILLKAVGGNIEILTDFDNYVDDIYENLKIDDVEFRNHWFQRVFNEEFDGQMQCLLGDKECAVELKARGIPIGIKFINNKFDSIENLQIFETEPMYIDTPFVLHNSKGIMDGPARGHRQVLRNSLFQVGQENIGRDIRIEKMLEDVLSKLTLICGGNVTQEERKGELVYRDDKMNLQVDNLSAGLKTFAILKILLLNGTVQYNGTIILDEPEIHLHPEWQLKFAELIVLLQKTFNLHILLNTHSPYFLNAIEAYSEHHKIADVCKYYLAEDIDGYGVIKDVTDNTKVIYEKLVRPLQILEDLENE